MDGDWHDDLRRDCGRGFRRHVQGDSQRELRGVSEFDSFRDSRAGSQSDLQEDSESDWREDSRGISADAGPVNKTMSRRRPAAHHALWNLCYSVLSTFCVFPNPQPLVPIPSCLMKYAPGAKDDTSFEPV